MFRTFYSKFVPLFSRKNRKELTNSVNYSCSCRLNELPLPNIEKKNKSLKGLTMETGGMVQVHWSWSVPPMPSGQAVQIQLPGEGRPIMMLRRLGSSQAEFFDHPLRCALVSQAKAIGRGSVWPRVLIDRQPLTSKWRSRGSDTDSGWLDPRMGLPVLELRRQ